MTVIADLRSSEASLLEMASMPPYSISSLKHDFSIDRNDALFVLRAAFQTTLHRNRCTIHAFVRSELNLTALSVVNATIHTINNVLAIVTAKTLVL